ncbi:MAG: bifunctional diaminohydroxyphosphoribosylaminopyrimidine deaminase/5-amino-6-(5-phosphoribosylamino)uracil reductase RibD [Coriobacteriia bacterium]|nr:bifunctional diaminohydroxyphosphoribosylaminopyrimidine deaminase/5-amino-6-(5-phosphoribosylamino)uracil reductase RibD [Coriobacteriia bacterium]
MAEGHTREDYMRRALRLAAKGAGWVNPNPQVGCVIVKDGRVVGEGWHTAFGQLHAEREALAACTESPAGATAYVTLEPCCHQGKTPPCTEGLIEAGIARVVVGAPDPNPLVAGKGVAQLRAAGIEVEEGVLVQDCQALNRAWFHFIQTGRPYVMAKFAQTLDGRIGLRVGESCWLTGEEARTRTHADRARFAAIAVGVNTVLVDDPLLTCRAPGRVKQPLRVVVDSCLRIPLDAQVVRTVDAAPLLVATTFYAPEEKRTALQEAGATVVVLPDCEGQVDLEALLDHLGEQGIDSLIVEGGPALHAAFFAKGLVNGVQAYVAPRVFGAGAADAPTPGSVGCLPLEDPQAAPRIAFERITQLGEDVLMEGQVK